MSLVIDKYESLAKITAKMREAAVQAGAGGDPGPGERGDGAEVQCLGRHAGLRVDAGSGDEHRLVTDGD